MPDTRFYKNKGPYTLKQISDFLGIPLSFGDNLETKIQNVATLQTATSRDLACYHSYKYRDALQSTQAAACIIAQDFIDHRPEHLPVFISKTPYRDYARLLSFFYEDQRQVSGIASTAMISPSAKIGKGCKIGHYVVIEDGVEIGDNCYIGNHTVIEENSIIGNACKIDSHVSISHSIIGNNVGIKTGARLGQRGFGFDMDAEGHIPVPQLGLLIIEDNVDIGANTTIDRGSNANTHIKKGVRIDNLVMIAHNVVVGEHSVLVAQVGIAGSTELGKFVIAAGQVGIAGHLKIGDGSIIAAKSGVFRDVDAESKIAGIPAIPMRNHFKQVALLNKLVSTKGK